LCELSVPHKKVIIWHQKPFSGVLLLFWSLKAPIAINSSLFTKK